MLSRLAAQNLVYRMINPKVSDNYDQVWPLEGALDLVQIPAAWSTGRERGAWERQHQFGGRRVCVSLPSLRGGTAVQRTPTDSWYSSNTLCL